MPNFLAYLRTLSEQHQNDPRMIYQYIDHDGNIYTDRLKTEDNINNVEMAIYKGYTVVVQYNIYQIPQISELSKEELSFVQVV